jgi:ribosomal protein L29
MKSSEILKNLRAKDKKGLFHDLKESEKKLTQLRFNQALRKLKNFHEITVTRKKIANIWTILQEKTLEDLNKTILNKER